MRSISGSPALLDLTFAEFKAAVEAFDPGDTDGLRDQPRRFRARVFEAGSGLFSLAFRADGPTLALGQVSMQSSTDSGCSVGLLVAVHQAVVLPYTEGPRERTVDENSVCGPIQS
jgi:hypothetical protein